MTTTNRQVQLQMLRQDEGDVYEHLVTVLMNDKMSDSASKSFEELSIHAKLRPLRPSPAAAMSKPRPRHPLESTQQTKWTANATKLLKASDAVLPVDSRVKFSDLPEDLSLLEWAGVGLGAAEAYRVYVSLKALAESLPAEVGRLRFWGRVSTRSQPYYIAEGGAPGEAGASTAEVEGRDGLNMHCYWTTQDVEAGAGGWKQLPQVTCAQVVASCRFRRFLTGSLEAPVPSYPPFPGRERSLLRALIARITGATLISPEGFFEVSEPEDEEAVPVVVPVEVEEELRAASELCEATAWRHHRQQPNALGRVTALPAVSGAEDEEPAQGGEEEEEEVPGLLAEVRAEAWSFRVSPGGAGSSASSTAVARSVEWPGAVAVAAGRRHVCLYMGYGARFADSREQPAQPAPVSAEWRPEETEAETAVEGVSSSPVMLEAADPVRDPSQPQQPAVAEEADDEGAADAAGEDDEDRREAQENDAAEE